MDHSILTSGFKKINIRREGKYGFGPEGIRRRIGRLILGSAFRLKERSRGKKKQGKRRKAAALCRQVMKGRAGFKNGGNLGDRGKDGGRTTERGDCVRFQGWPFIGKMRRVKDGSGRGVTGPRAGRRGLGTG